MQNPYNLFDNVLDKLKQMAYHCNHKIKSRHLPQPEGKKEMNILVRLRTLILVIIFLLVLSPIVIGAERGGFPLKITGLALPGFLYSSQGWISYSCVEVKTRDLKIGGIPQYPSVMLYYLEEGKKLYADTTIAKLRLGSGDNPLYSEQRYGLRLNWGIPVLFNNTYLYGKYRIEKVTLWDRGVFTSDFGDYMVGSLGISLVYDSQDDKIHPTTGWYGEFSSEQGLKALGGSEDFSKFGLELKRFLSLGKTGIVGFHLLGEKGLNLPIYEKYVNNLSALRKCEVLRGYGRNRFMGDVALTGNLEYRSPTYWFEWFGIGGVVFLDVGRIWNSDGDSIKFPQDIRFGTGVGMRMFFAEKFVMHLDFGFSEETIKESPGFSFWIGAFHVF